MGATVTVFNETSRGMTFIKDISNNGYVNSVSYIHNTSMHDIVEACHYGE